MLASQVRIRGWPFPVDERGRLSLCENYVASEVEWENHWETWRLFQSGMFVWFKANRWDLLPERPGGGGSKPGQALSVGDTIYLLRECFEFASRLALTGAVADRMLIEVAAHGLKGQRLWAEPWHDTPGRPCEASGWSFSREYSRQQLAAESRELGLAGALDLFQRFGWDASSNVLESILDR